MWLIKIAVILFHPFKNSFEIHSALRRLGLLTRRDAATHIAQTICRNNQKQLLEMLYRKRYKPIRVLVSETNSRSRAHEVETWPNFERVRTLISKICSTLSIGYQRQITMLVLD